MFEQRGRKNVEAYVDGVYVMVKKPVHITKTATAVILPKEWIDAVSGGREIKYLLLDVRDNQIIIKPHFDAIEGVE
jgi:hypothetical protein